MYIHYIYNITVVTLKLVTIGFSLVFKDKDIQVISIRIYSFVHSSGRPYIGLIE